MDVGTPMLEGLTVLDFTEPSGWLCGRILADLGAEVTLIEPPGGHPGRAQRYAFAALNAGKGSVVADINTGEGLEQVRKLLGSHEVVIESGQSRLASLRRMERAPQARPRRGPRDQFHGGNVWCAITPFGLTGPKAATRASDLGLLAQSGTMFMTGDPDRAPLRCTFPTSWYHGCAEAAVAILAALHHREMTKRGQLVDVSLQEAHLMATMSRVGQHSLTGQRGERAGALMRVGHTVQREIWPCADGFVSFGLRGGPARIPGLKRLVAWIVEERLETPALTARDWDSYNHTVLTQEEVDAISEPIARFFLTKTMTELYDAALTRGLMLAPANTAREILASRQYTSRALFTELDDPDLGQITIPRRFVVSDGVPGATRPAPRVGESSGWWSLLTGTNMMPPEQAFEGLKVLEFGAGAAGPLSTRYFADHGATVVRVESSVRPDFLRLYAITAKQRSLEASPMFAAFNCNKLGITLNFKHPEARAIALELVRWADVVEENFAPGAMARFGLAYEDLVKEKPDLVMISTCLHGQTGPERDYPGFGGQGSALSGFNHLTGWPDREPLGPYGTITDSLAPRFAAAAVMAALLRKRRTGQGAYLDLSQVECAVYSLAETIVEQSVTGTPPGRLGNRSPNAAPHGVFRCIGDDRWIALAIWTDEEWATLVETLGNPAWADQRFTKAEDRLGNVDELEKHLEAWTESHDRDELADLLQSRGLEANAVLDLADCFNDPQLAHREHFRRLDHPVIGAQEYEALGFRLADSPPRFTSPGPTLGRDNEHVYKTILGMSDADYERRKADAVFD